MDYHIQSFTSHPIGSVGANNHSPAQDFKPTPKKIMNNYFKLKYFKNISEL